MIASPCFPLRRGHVLTLITLVTLMFQMFLLPLDPATKGSPLAPVCGLGLLAQGPCNTPIVRDEILPRTLQIRTVSMIIVINSLCPVIMLEDFLNNLHLETALILQEALGMNVSQLMLLGLRLCGLTRPPRLRRLFQCFVNYIEELKLPPNLTIWRHASPWIAAS